MGTTLVTNRFDTLRGGQQKSISLEKFMDLSKGSERPPFIVERFIIPNLGETGWGEVVIREGATRVRRKFRR